MHLYSFNLYLQYIYLYINVTMIIYKSDIYFLNCLKPYRNIFKFFNMLLGGNITYMIYEQLTNVM